MTLSRRPDELPNILLGHTHRSTADEPTPAAIDAVVSAYRAIHHICGARKGDHLVGIPPTSAAFAGSYQTVLFITGRRKNFG